MLPEGWQSSTIGAEARFLSGGTPSKENLTFWGGKFPWISARDMKVLYLRSTSLGLTDAGRQASAIAPANSVLVLTRGMTLLKELPVCVLETEMAFNQDIKALVPKGTLDARFLAYQLLSRKNEILNLVDTAGHGTGRLDTDLLKSVSFCVPPLPEQQRIAEILSTWDEAIYTANRVRANLEHQSSVVVGVLTSGRQHFGSRAGWKIRAITDLIRESRKAGSGGHEARKLTVKLYGKGVIHKAEKRPGSESTRYYRRSAGQFIYSKLDFLNGAFGIVPKSLDGYESTLDLPAFDFLPDVDPNWFLNFVCREEFYQGQLGLANGGRKARRVNPDDLLRVRIDVPPLDEQRAIATAIGVGEAQVIAARQRVEFLKKEKAALMADLLTGKRRVHLPAAKPAL
jgi:type I restriction enzyme, S subunit